MDRVLDLLHKVKYEQDGTLTFRRSCAHGVCGSDAMLINGRNRLACKIRVDQLGNARSPSRRCPGLPVVKDLVVDMDGFFAKYRSVQPFLIRRGAGAGARAAPVAGGPRALRRHDQVHPVRRLHDVVPVVLGAARRTSGRPRSSTPTASSSTSRDEAAEERLEILADKDGVWRCRTIFNCIDACPRGINITQAILEVVVGDRGASRLSARRRWPERAGRRSPARTRHLIIRTDGAARGNPGPASLGAALIDGSRGRTPSTRRPGPTRRSPRRSASRRTTSPSGRASCGRSSSARRARARRRWTCSWTRS